MSLRGLPDRPTLERAAGRVADVMGTTPTRNWPLLSERCGCAVFVKHENHTPIGAFKVRGGLLYLESLRREHPEVSTVVAATRGNHGQSIAWAAGRVGLRARIVVPHGNNPEKNAAMRAFGAELVEFGADFQEAYDHARELADGSGGHLVPSYDAALLSGVASYAMELFADAPTLDAIYVPIGLGSGICSVLAAREALGLRTEVIGVVADGAPAYALSFDAGKPVETGLPDTLADGLAVRVPHPDALEVILAGASRVVAVTDAAIELAMASYFRDTHNIAEGAGAAPLAALFGEKERMRGKQVGLVLSGGNVDRATYLAALERGGVALDEAV